MCRFLNIFLCLLSVFIGGYAHASGQWQLSSEKSRVDFIGKSTLHDFNGTAQELSGVLRQDYNLAKGFIDVDVAGLTTDEPGRDKNMYQMFDVSRYPQIHFVFNDTVITDVLNHHEGVVRQEN